MDYYDKAVAYLTEHPRDIYSAWGRPHAHRAGWLFAFATKDRLDYDSNLRPNGCGCLTQIHSDLYSAATPELTAAIKQDDRIPDSAGDITPEDLPVFAEWQRRIDAELGRTPPVWTEPEPAQ